MVESTRPSCGDAWHVLTAESARIRASNRPNLANHTRSRDAGSLMEATNGVMILLYPSGSQVVRGESCRQDSPG